MAFPDSFTLFDRIDVSSSVDMVAKLDSILLGVNNNAGKLMLLQSEHADMMEDLALLTSKEQIEASNDVGWRVII